jgi:hypothetical protein
MKRLRLRDLDQERVAAGVFAGWQRLTPAQRERLAQLADQGGGFEVRWDFSVDGRLRVWWGEDVMVADLPLRDLVAAEPRLDA